MDLHLLLDNLTNPALLFFVLGILAVQLKSDLEIPGSSSKFISLYLLFSIGFKGGQELSHSALDQEIVWTLVFGVASALLVPLYTFFLLRARFSVQNSVAIAASYGSVSAVTFVTAIAFLELEGVEFGGHMVAAMALMEAPAIVIGLLLMHRYSTADESKLSISSTVKHALTNGSVLLILGSLLIGFMASEQQAEGIKPFTTDIFKGFLAVFLLDMGITSGRKLNSFLQNGWFALLFALVVPLVNGTLIAASSAWISPVEGNRFLLAVLGASASYIAVPAAMKIAAPKANVSLYLPMALAITFPLNITLGLPWYLCVVQWVV